jgi:hypothetical protein
MHSIPPTNHFKPPRGFADFEVGFGVALSFFREEFVSERNIKLG